MAKKTAETIENTAEKRISDSLLGVPRALVFILTIIVTVIVTLVILQKTGFLVLEPKAQQELNGGLSTEEAIVNLSAENFTLKNQVAALTEDVEALKEGFTALDEQQMDLAAQLREFAGATAAPQPIMPEETTPAISPENSAEMLEMLNSISGMMNQVREDTQPSPLPPLNYLLIRYDAGDNLQDAFTFLKPFVIVSSELQEALTHLNATSTPKIITKHDMWKAFGSVMHTQKKPQTAEEEKGFLNNLIVVRKKDGNQKNYGQFKPLQSALMAKDFSTALAEIEALEGEEFSSLKNTVVTYVMQQQALENFISLYTAYYRDEVLNGSD